MGIAQRCIRNQETLLLGGPLGKFLRAQRKQQLASAVGRRLMRIEGGSDWCRQRFLWMVTFRVRVAVHRHLADEIEQLGCAISARFEREKLWRRINQRRCGLTAAELF